MNRIVLALALSASVLAVTNTVDARGFRLFGRCKPCCQPRCQPVCCAPVYVPCSNCNPSGPIHAPGTVTYSHIPQVVIPPATPAPSATQAKYSGGAQIKRILYAPDLMPGKKPKNLSELREGDIILEANGQKVTANKVLLEEREKSAGKTLALRVWDPQSKQAFTTTLDLAEPNQLVLEFDMAEADVTVPYFLMKRPQ